MLSYRRQNNSLKDNDFSVDNPIGRARFEKAIRDEVKMLQTMPKNDTVYGFYNYKRWLWLQFPWICLDLTVDYDKLMDVCFGFKRYSYLCYESEYELLLKLYSLITEAKERKTKKTPISAAVASNMSLSLMSRGVILMTC